MEKGGYSASVKKESPYIHRCTTRDRGRNSAKTERVASVWEVGDTRLHVKTKSRRSKEDTKERNLRCRWGGEEGWGGGGGQTEKRAEKKQKLPLEIVLRRVDEALFLS